MSAPCYIVFEGSEAVGKSTQARRLAESIGAVLTRETGGTDIGVRLRSILHDTAVTDLDDRAETLIAAADRAQHIAEVVRPALTAGRHVVSDRSLYSSIAYQGYGRGVPIDDVMMINTWAVDGIWPDLVILMTVPPEVVDRRMRKRDLDRFEMAGADFHARVDAGFARMAADDPERWVTVRADGEPNTVAATIRTAVADRLGVVV